MNEELISKIKSKMIGELLPEQLKKLEETLIEVLKNDKTEERFSKDNEKNIKCNIGSVDTNTIREYLINYQKINNCSNVTLDTIRRILSSFYKWLEEEDFILKSPMKRIHRIKTPVIIKTAAKGNCIL